MTWAGKDDRTIGLFYRVLFGSDDEIPSRCQTDYIRNKSGCKVSRRGTAFLSGVGDIQSFPTLGKDQLTSA